MGVATLQASRLLRPAGFDELGLRRAISERMLPFLVAAMAFLAGLAMAGWVGAASLAERWQHVSASTLTVQVPKPGQAAVGDAGTRIERVMKLLVGTPGVVSARTLTDDELADLLKPWLGNDVERLAIPLPAVIAVQLTGPDVALESLARRLDDTAPGARIENQGVWASRLTVLGRSLEASAALALLLVTIVAAAVIAVATRAGLTARREAIDIVHGLGATDSYIAARFARRATTLAVVGGLIGTLLALPVLLTLGYLAAPFAGESAGLESRVGFLDLLPPMLWLALPGLPIAAAAIGFLTAQITVRRWLRRLP
jgi:cell division transport system permease protein